jgi:hypothetical protein
VTQEAAAQEYQEEVVTGLGLDLGKPPEDKFEFVGRLMKNNFIKSRPEYVEASGGAQPIKWRQEMQALDVVRQDGTPAIFSNSPNVTRGDGATQLGENSAYHVLTLAWKKVVGIYMSPEDPAASGYIGHAFRFRSHVWKRENKKTGDVFEVRCYHPTEHLGGADFQYVGDIRTLQGSQDDSGAPAAPPPPPPAQDDTDVGAQLVAVIAGQTRETALNAVFQSELKSVPMVFGKSLVAELNPPEAPLLDLLVEKGLIVIGTNGVIAAVPQPGAPEGTAAAPPQA